MLSVFTKVELNAIKFNTYDDKVIN